MPHIVSSEAWPLVLVELPPDPTPEVLEAFVREFDVVYARRQTFATLIDATGIRRVPGAIERKQLADWAASKKPLTQLYGAGTAYVITSPVVRAALTAIDWLFQPPCPQCWKTRRTDALAWCVDRLADRDVPTNERIDALLDRAV